ncbi:uncharacterized protein RJT20DRAFT_3656 [Scheffersomyces xylosifermentans]|uniref:uncharacterized protein n=1 Tax=Scheffersomyces xylosifermentans TaxID=1304137 RepID=UPI00315D0AA9
MRTYVAYAVLCGTNRFFFSDHETFSGFFEFEFDKHNAMSVNYYEINDPQSVSDGITLRSAIAGFFYNTPDEAEKVKEDLKEKLEDARQSKTTTDPLGNIANKDPRNSGSSSGPYLATHNRGFK